MMSQFVRNMTKAVTIKGESRQPPQLTAIGQAGLLNRPVKLRALMMHDADDAPIYLSVCSFMTKTLKNLQL